MRNKKSINRYPFIILGIIYFILLIITFYKSKDRKRHVVLLLNYAGFAYIFEYFVVALFDGYVYKPNFFKQKKVDSIFGAVWSQFFYVPVAALFITVFGLGWKMKLLFSTLFLLIERIFIKIGVYKNKWWKTSYTFLLILLSFFLNDKWNQQLIKRNPFYLFISFTNTIQVTWMNILYIFALFKKVRYGIPPFLSWKEHFKIAPLNVFLISLLTAWWIKDDSVMAKLKSLLVMIVADFILRKNKMLKVKRITYLPIIYFLNIKSASILRKLVYGDVNSRIEDSVSNTR
ncbi:hypothetical protein [Bacillus marasmi]|uniref:hypothetical protein n=1 Tax=Bacillus marasmi TaxID=1926279 RepID=UPI0011CCACC6|nr:hypothetical protein [Bacillus marasmi]